MSFSWDGARKGKKNPFFGRKHSVATRKKMSLAAEGKKNMMWKGNAVGYHALHDFAVNAT